MEEKEGYSIARRLFFWLFFFIFVIFTPLIIYYSLGYKFDTKSRKFLKTGIISIKTFPKAVEVYIDGKKQAEAAPCVLREVFPKEYRVSLEKAGFYPYSIPIRVRPSLVSDIDVILIPRMRNVDKLKFDFNIYKFFFSKRFFGEKIIIFSDKGVYLLDSDFKNAEQLSSQDFGEALANTIMDLKEAGNKLMFWSQKSIWLTDALATLQDKKENEVIPVIYTAQEYVKDVFFGLKERYLIIQDGLKIIALDTQNPQAYFLIFELKSINSRIFYETRSETLYIEDKIPETNSFSLFRIELINLINEKVPQPELENIFGVSRLLRQQPLAPAKANE